MHISDVRILVVDDSKMMRQLIQSMLLRHCMRNVVAADNGETALSLVESLAPHIIISDWRMTGMDGLELLRRVRAMRDRGTTPFIMVTSEDEIAHVRQAVESGVSDYVVKPFKPEALLGKVLGLLKRLDPALCVPKPKVPANPFGSAAG